MHSSADEKLFLHKFVSCCAFFTLEKCAHLFLPTCSEYFFLDFFFSFDLTKEFQIFAGVNLLVLVMDFMFDDHRAQRTLSTSQLVSNF